MYDWYPHPGPQHDFCERDEFEVFFGGAKGPGKTDCLIMEALRGTTHPRYHGLILRRTFPRLQEIIDRCWAWYPKAGGDYRAGEHRWYFPGGAKISLGHLQHEGDKYNYHGKEFQFIGFDELTEFEESQYLFLMAQIRTAHADLPMYMRSTSNPGGLGHTWVKKRFVDVADPGRVYIDPATGQSRIFIPATVYDNPSIMEADPGYVRRLEALPDLERKRFLLGEWDAFDGQVFSELTDATHGCDDFAIPPEWEKYMVFDWGYARPFCALWFAVDYDGTIYLYREFYGMKDDDPNKGLRLTNTEICREIFRHEKEKIKTRIADPACWGPTKLKGRNDMMGPSFAEDAGKEGLWFLKADNDRLRGVQQFHQRLMVDTETNGDGEIVSENPRFVAFRSCKRWWAEVQDLREDPKNPEDIDTDQPDEGYDCTRYMFMSRPVMPKKQFIVPPGSFKAERQRLIKAKKYAQRHGTSLAAAYQRIR